MGSRRAFGTLIAWLHERDHLAAAGPPVLATPTSYPAAASARQAASAQRCSPSVTSTLGAAFCRPRLTTAEGERRGGALAAGNTRRNSRPGEPGAGDEAHDRTQRPRRTGSHEVEAGHR